MSNDNELATDDTFEFDRLHGYLRCQEKQSISVSFNPSGPGLFKAIFQLKTKEGVVSLWLQGEHHELMENSVSHYDRDLRDIDGAKMERSTPKRDFVHNCILSEEKQGTILYSAKIKRSSLDFEKVKRGGSKVLHVKVSNPDEKNVEVSLIATGPFKIPIRKVPLPSRSYFILPIFFAPTQIGSVEERLIVRRNGHSITRISLKGMGCY
jgi:hypothetical protein